MKEKKFFVTGHRGLVGSACVAAFQRHGYEKILTQTRQETDLTNQEAVERFFEKERPQLVLMAAARVGGIIANQTQPVEFLIENLEIQNNLMRAAYKFGVEKLLFLGSSCIYPKKTPQPMKEEYLLSGPMEETNISYALAKICGIQLCEAYRTQYGMNFISAMPCNMYGTRDNFDPITSHVIPGLVRKFHEAKEKGASFVTVWGTGTPRREFLNSYDLAEACVCLMENYSETKFVNVGSGDDLSIKSLVEMVKNIVGFQGEVEWDQTKPDGHPQKLLEVSKIKELGWNPEVPLEKGIRQMYEWWVKNQAD